MVLEIKLWTKVSDFSNFNKDVIQEQSISFSLTYFKPERSHNFFNKCYTVKKFVRTRDKDFRQNFMLENIQFSQGKQFTYVLVSN